MQINSIRYRFHYNLLHKPRHNTIFGTSGKNIPVELRENTDQSTVNPDISGNVHSQIQPPPPPQTPPEIAAFMRSLGLEPTNSKESDHAAIMNKLLEMKISAKSEKDIQKITDLQNEFYLLIQSVEQTGHPPSITSGTEQIGELNKFFMLK